MYYPTELTFKSPAEHRLDENKNGWADDNYWDLEMQISLAKQDSTSGN